MQSLTQHTDQYRANKRTARTDEWQNSWKDDSIEDFKCRHRILPCTCGAGKAKRQPWPSCCHSYGEPRSLLGPLVGRCERQATNCLDWQGPADKNGYGCTRVDGQSWRVYRLVWTLVHGPVPDDLKVLHHCDRPPCCEITRLCAGFERRKDSRY
jgi:hypothetical protein